MPLEIRHRLGVKEGDRIELVIDNGQTVMRPSRLLGNPFEKYIGILPAFESKYQVNQWVAGLREDDRLIRTLIDTNMLRPCGPANLAPAQYSFQV